MKRVQPGAKRCRLTALPEVKEETAAQRDNKQRIEEGESDMCEYE